MLAAVTAAVRAICPTEIPPKSASSMKTGSPAANITSTFSKLARSFPSTSSWSERFVSSSRTKVLRSFSWATALAASMAEKKTARANCKRGENLEDQAGELRQVAHVADDLRARQHQPGRADQQQQGRRVGTAGDVDPRAPRGNHDFAGKYGTEKQPESPWSRAS